MSIQATSYEKNILLSSTEIKLCEIERVFPFKAACRLTPWFSKKNEPRIITMVDNEENYKRIIATMPYACEALDGGPVKAYLDIDFKIDLKEVDAVKGADGKTRYFEKGERSLIERIKGEIARIDIFKGRKFYAMTRENRLIKGNKVKISWRIVFPDIIIENQVLLGTYLKAIGCTPDAPFDLSVYNKGRIMNAALCVKPDKEGESPCPPLDPLLNWGGTLEDRLITVVDPALPIVKSIDEWLNNSVNTGLGVKSYQENVVDNNNTDEKDEVKKLLDIISPNCSYDRWFKVLCAVANTLGKHNDVYDLADTWSSHGEKYTPQSFGKTWSSLKHNGTLSIATLHYFAKEENANRYTELFAKGCKSKNIVDIYKSRDYADIKTTFEKTVFKVIKPVSFYQKKSDGSGYFITTEDKIKAAYRNVIYKKEDTGKTVSFINDWLTDPTMRAYDRTEFDPSNNVGNDVFNTFTGFAAERIPAVDDDDVDELVKPFVDHMKMLIGDDGAKFVMMWLANIIQNPTKRAEVAIVLHSSREGTGKSSPFKYFGEKVIGLDWYKPTGDPAHDLFDKHSNGIENKLMVQVEEARGADLHKNMDRLKDLITNNRSRLERKGMDACTINNYANFVFTTNNDNPIKISASDRRFVVFDCNDARVGDGAYFSNFIDAMDNPKWARAMFQYLKGMQNLPRGSAFQLIRPITDYYKEIQRINIPNWAKYLAVKSVDGESEYQASDLFKSYTYWADANGYGQTKLTQTGFALKIKHIDGMVPIRKKGGMHYKIDWGMLVAYMKANNLWDEEAY